MHRSAALMVLLVLPGCSTRLERYWSLRGVCGMAVGEHTPSWFYWTADGDRAVEPVTRECARAVGQAVGIDWAAFDEEPAGFEIPLTQPQNVVAGVVQLLAVDLGTYGELAAVLHPDEGVDFIARDVLAGEPDAPAAALWLDIVREGIVSVGPDDGTCGGAAFHINWSGEMVYCDTIEAGIYEPGDPEMTAILIHEASHPFVGKHRAADGWDDLDLSGAYGVEMRYLAEWRRHSPLYTRDPVDCHSAVRYQCWACGSIEDHEGVPECEDACSTNFTECDVLYP